MNGRRIVQVIEEYVYVLRDGRIGEWKVVGLVLDDGSMIEIKDGGLSHVPAKEAVKP